jgi:hypothetical protein
MSDLVGIGDSFTTSPLGERSGRSEAEGRVRGPYPAPEGPLTRRFASTSPPKGEVWEPLILTKTGGV